MTFAAADSDSFARMMRSLPTGVCIVTAISDEQPAGMTASSVTPVSFDPMLIALALRPASGTLATARAAGRFAINFIAADRAAIAVQFASRRRELRSAQPTGDHVLTIGAVRAMHISDPSAPPLITHRGRLAALTTTALDGVQTLNHHHQTGLPMGTRTCGRLPERSAGSRSVRSADGAPSGRGAPSH